MKFILDPHPHNYPHAEYNKKAENVLPKNVKTRPAFVKNEETLFRIIHVYFHESIRGNVSTLGNTLKREQLDTRRKRKMVFEVMLQFYNDEDIIEQFTLGESIAAALNEGHG